jgi:hypothetical protein
MNKLILSFVTTFVLLGCSTSAVSASPPKSKCAPTESLVFACDDGTQSIFFCSTVASGEERLQIHREIASKSVETSLLTGTHLLTGQDTESGAHRSFEELHFHASGHKFTLTSEESDGAVSRAQASLMKIDDPHAGVFECRAASIVDNLTSLRGHVPTKDL